MPVRASRCFAKIGTTRGMQGIDVEGTDTQRPARDGRVDGRAHRNRPGLLPGLADHRHLADALPRTCTGRPRRPRRLGVRRYGAARRAPRRLCGLCLAARPASEVSLDRRPRRARAVRRDRRPLRLRMVERPGLDARRCLRAYLGGDERRVRGALGRAALPHQTVAHTRLRRRGLCGVVRNLPDRGEPLPLGGIDAAPAASPAIGSRFNNPASRSFAPRSCNAAGRRSDVRRNRPGHRGCGETGDSAGEQNRAAPLAPLARHGHPRGYIRGDKPPLGNKDRGFHRALHARRRHRRRGGIGRDSNCDQGHARQLLASLPPHHTACHRLSAPHAGTAAGAAVLRGFGHRGNVGVLPHLYLDPLGAHRHARPQRGCLRLRLGSNLPHPVQHRRRTALFDCRPFDRTFGRRRLGDHLRCRVHLRIRHGRGECGEACDGAGRGCRRCAGRSGQRPGGRGLGCRRCHGVPNAFRRERRDA